MANTAPQIRAGRVSSIDYARGTYTVAFADRDAVSCTINAVSNGRYKMPELGQVVSVQLNGNGTVEGSAAGTVWNKSNAPVGGRKGLYRQEYGRTAGASFEEYDDQTGAYTQYIKGAGGRNYIGGIYDQTKAGYSLTAAAQVAIASVGAGVSLTAGTSAAIAAAQAIDMEAGSYIRLTAAGDIDIQCGANSTVTVEGNQTVKVTGDMKHNVTGSVEQTVAGNVKQDVTGNVEQTVAGDMVVTVTGSVKVVVGGTVIEADPSAVTVETAQAAVSAQTVTVDAGAGDVKVDGVSLTHHTHKDGGAGEPEKA